MNDDTIAALSTPPGKGGIAVIRISGSKTASIVRKITEGQSGKIPPRQAVHTYITKRGRRIEECLCTFFKSPHSYTGEDLAEISIHANLFLVEEILDLIYKFGARGALAGEFTFRAFKNNKMDLIQAESVNELINANSRNFSHLKFNSLEGQLSHLVRELKDNLKTLAVNIETEIEFKEAQLLQSVPLINLISDTNQKLEKILSHANFNDILDRGIKLVIMGKVNVGKSSLFNTLIMKERSITSPTPGTTRDFIEGKIYLEGYPIELIDIAGINRDASDDIESEGIRRSFNQISESGAVIFLLDGSGSFDQTDIDLYDRIRDKKHKLILVNKIDQVEPKTIQRISAFFKQEKIARISVLEQRNLAVIHDFLKQITGHFQQIQNDLPLTVNHRQKTLLTRIHSAVGRVLKHCAGMLEPVNDLEIIAEEIRLSLQLIGELLGEITTEQILSDIFAGFCIGK